MQRWICDISCILRSSIRSIVLSYEKDWQCYEQMYETKYLRSIGSIPFDLLGKFRWILQNKTVQQCNWFWSQTLHLHYIPNIWYLLCINNSLLSLVMYNKYNGWILTLCFMPAHKVWKQKLWLLAHLRCNFSVR